MKKDHDIFCLEGEGLKDEPYHYRGCGLDGIYLMNGYEVETHDGEQYVSITDLEGLHQEIGRHLVMFRKALTPKEIRFLRNTMGLTQAELAKRLGNNSQSVARWEKGECEIPGASERLLRALFLLSCMTESQLAQLKELLETKLEELDDFDELTVPTARFKHGDRWAETPRELVAAY